jgi:phasin family protein
MNKKPNPTARSRPSAPTLTVVADAPAAHAQAAETTTLPPNQMLSNQTKGTKTVFNTSVDFAAIGKENLEAFAASGKIWAAGVQDLTKQFAATTKASIDDSLATFKALSSVKSVKEAIDLQSNYGKTAVAKALSETSKLTEASLKLTEQALAPITARMAATVEAFTKVA